MVFEKNEKIISLIVVSIINILCIAKFFIDMIANWFLMDGILNSSNYYEDYIQYISNFTNFKVILIFTLCICIAILVLSFCLFAIKKKHTRSAIFTINIILLFLLITFVFIGTFICGGTYYGRICFNLFLSNCKFLIISSLLSVVSGFIICSFANALNTEETKKEYEEKPEETVIIEEINKLKAKIRIKNLEKEYFELQNQLNETNKKE